MAPWSGDAEVKHYLKCSTDAIQKKQYRSQALPPWMNGPMVRRCEIRPMGTIIGSLRHKPSDEADNPKQNINSVLRSSLALHQFFNKL